MSRFKELKNLEEIAGGAALKENETTRKKKTKNILVYGVPVEWQELIESNGETFSGFAKRAIRKLLKEEDLI